MQWSKFHIHPSLLKSDLYSQRLCTRIVYVLLGSVSRISGYVQSQYYEYSYIYISWSSSPVAWLVKLWTGPSDWATAGSRLKRYMNIHDIVIVRSCLPVRWFLFTNFTSAEAIVTASRKNSLSLAVSYVYGGHSLNILLYCDGGLRHSPRINYLWTVQIMT